MNTQNEKLQQLYNNLPAINQMPVRNTIIDGCFITPSTFYKWLRGDVEIKKVYYPIIAAAFGVAVDIIFPESDINE